MGKKLKTMNPTATFTFDTPAYDATAPLPSLAGVRSLGFDTETTTEPSLWQRSLAGISYWLPDGRGGYIPLRHPGGGNYPEANVQAWARHELAGKTLVVANAKHECHTLTKWGLNPEECGIQFRDVFNQAALLNDHRYKLNLGLIAEEELGRTKLEQSHTLLHQLPASEAAPVAIEDAELVWLLNQAYEPKIAAEDLGRVLQLEDSLVYVVCEMERNGTYLDVEKLVRWRAEVHQEVEERLMKIHRETGLRVDPGSWKDLEKLFAHLGIEEYPKTPSGQPSVTEDALLELIGAYGDTGGPALTCALEARQLQFLLSKYLDAYMAVVGPDGRLRYDLHQLRGDTHGTVTGRFSASDVNIQQVSVQAKQPKLTQRWPIRELFVPGPGEACWYSADASQIEFRLFAHYAAVTKDPWTGRFVGTRLAEAYRQDPRTDFHAKVVEWTGLARGFAKNVSFRKLYGGGSRKGAMMMRIPYEEAVAIDGKYDREFPEAKRLINIMSDVAEARRYVRTLLGRRSRFVDHDRFYKALNMVLQGGAADIMKKKLLEQYRVRKEHGLTMRLTVHDETDGGLQDRAMAPRMDQVLNEQTTDLQVPILWESGTGRNWHEAH